MHISILFFHVQCYLFQSTVNLYYWVLPVKDNNLYLKDTTGVP